MVKTIKKAQPKRGRSSSPRRRSFSLWKIPALGVLCLVAAALCVAYLSMFVSPEVLWLPFFFGLYYIPLVLVNVVFMIAALCARSVSFLIPALALAPSLLFADEFVKFGGKDVDVPSENVKIMTYNVGRYGAGPEASDKSENRAALENYIAEENPDIVCLQEFRVEDTLSFGTVFSSYPYCYHRLHKESGAFSGNITFSRYPIVRRESHIFPESLNMFLSTDIAIGARTVRIFNCHLESYGISFTSLVKKLSVKEYFADEIVQLHEHLRSGCLKRTGQVDTIAVLCRESPYPTMICGDFNDTPISYAYHHLLSGHKDAFVESGKGLSSSYSVLWPLLRIDYVFVPEEYSSAEYKVARVPYSDHYPVTSLLCFD